MKKFDQEEVGRCEGCGEFKRWADLGFMYPDGGLILCRKCASKHAKRAALDRENALPAVPKIN